MPRSLHAVVLAVALLASPVSGFVNRNRLPRFHLQSRYGGIPPPSDISPLGMSSSDAENASDSSNPLLNRWRSLPPDTREDTKSTIIALCFAIVVRLFIVEPRFIPSLSMYPTFDIGDQLLVDKISKVGRHYQRRDVVVFNPSEQYIDMTGNTEALIKRIIAVEGDTVEIKNRKVYVNGVEQVEPFINEDPDYDLKPTVVPPGMLLVLGDNRNHSFDSHLWGFLPEKNVIGRAVLKYWPPWRAGFVEGSM